LGSILQQHILTSSSAQADNPVFRDVQVFRDGGDYWTSAFGYDGRVLDEWRGKPHKGSHE
jgi:hypothetical protein